VGQALSPANVFSIVSRGSVKELRGLALTAPEGGSSARSPQHLPFGRGEPVLERLAVQQRIPPGLGHHSQALQHRFQILAARFRQAVERLYLPRDDGLLLRRQVVERVPHPVQPGAVLRRQFVVPVQALPEIGLLLRRQSFEHLLALLRRHGHQALHRIAGVS